MMSFAIWVTGLPASGKSTITEALQSGLEAAGLQVEVLESDTLRRLLTPSPSYSDVERNLFYRAMAFAGSRLVAPIGGSWSDSCVRCDGHQTDGTSGSAVDLVRSAIAGSIPEAASREESYARCSRVETWKLCSAYASR